MASSHRFRFMVYVICMALVCLGVFAGIAPAAEEPRDQSERRQSETDILELEPQQVSFPILPVRTTSPQGESAPATAYEVEKVEEDWTMRDGVTLPVSVYYPVTSNPDEVFPVIIYVHGWLCDKSMGEWSASDFAARGYVSVAPTMRGWFGAGGEVGCMDPDRDIVDLSDIITLVSEDERFPVLEDDLGPVVGITGYSMGGCFSYLIAPRKNPRPGDPGDPRVRAVVPMHGSFDLWFSLYPNSAFKLLWTTMLLHSTYAGNFSGCLMNILNLLLDGETDAWSKICKIIKYVQDLMASPSNKVAGELHYIYKIALQRRISEIDLVYQYGNKRSARYWCDEEDDGVVEHPIIAPMLILAGWQDDLFYANEAIMAYESTEAPKRMIIDNHGHAGGMPGPFPFKLPLNPSFEWTLQQVYNWFDHYLKGIDNGVEEEPRVVYYRDHNPGVFGQADGYPFSGTYGASYYFAGGEDGECSLFRDRADYSGSGPDMLLNIGFTGSITLPYFQDVTEMMGGLPLDIPVKIDLIEIPCTEVEYVSNPLAEDLTIMGPPMLELYYRCSKDFAQIIPFLYEVAPDGTERLVSRGFYEGYNPSRWSLSDTSDEPIQMQACYHRFPAGSRIKLELATADLPTIMPYLDMASILIYHEGSCASRLMLPVVPNTY
jgi:putative CocE/NonD family hydrolase